MKSASLKSIKYLFTCLFIFICGAGLGYKWKQYTYEIKFRDEADLTIISLLNNKNELNDKRALDAILKGIESRNDNKKLIEAIIVQLANKDNITMYGRQINDQLTDSSTPGRKRYDVHPYVKAGAGANDLAVYTDKTTGEVYVLLARKYAVNNHPEQGLAKRFILPGGYMASHPLEGGEWVENINSETKDKAEEAILQGKSGYSEAILRPDESNFILVEPKYDFNLEYTAVRELKEESNLEWDTSKSMPILISLGSDYGITNTKKLHTIVGNYLFDYGKREVAPSITPGSDIAEVRWISLSSITKKPNIPQQEAESDKSRYQVKLQDGTVLPIADYHGQIIEEYATKFLGKPLTYLEPSSK